MPNTYFTHRYLVPVQNAYDKQLVSLLEFRRFVSNTVCYTNLLTYLFTHFLSAAT